MIETLFWILAIGLSMFFGLYAPEIFVPEEERNKWNIQQKIYQGWFNFIGSLSGWGILYFLLVDRFDWGKSAAINSVGATDIILLVIAFAGISGQLPMTVMGVVQGSYVWLKNALNRLS